MADTHAEALESLRHQLADAEAHDDPGVVIDFEVARALLALEPLIAAARERCNSAPESPGCLYPGCDCDPGKVMAGVTDERGLLGGMVGLVDLLLTRNDLPAEVRHALETNHRIIDARAFLGATP